MYCLTHCPPLIFQPKQWSQDPFLLQLNVKMSDAVKALASTSAKNNIWFALGSAFSSYIPHREIGALIILWVIYVVCEALVTRFVKPTWCT